MQPDSVSPKHTPKSQKLFTTIQTNLRGYWDQARPYQKNLYRLGAILIASGLFHIIPLLVSGGDVTGPVSFRKPIVFGLSTGITLISTTWILTFMPKRHRLGAWLNAMIAFSFFVEIILVDMQTWRGVPSHFNFSTPFDSAVFSTMGVFINIVGLTILTLTIFTFTSLDTSPSMVWAIRIGMILLLTSQVFGNLIVANGIPKVIDMQTGDYIYDPANSPNVKGLEGLMKLPHFFTMHAIQLLPGLAFLMMFTPWNERKRTNAIFLSAAGYIGFVAIITIQTLQELGPFDLDLLSGIVLGISLIVFLSTYFAALAGIRSFLHPASSRT